MNNGELPVQGANGQARTAVLVDRHPLWLTAVEQVLGGAGIAILGTATRPSEALALLDELRPDLLATGIAMPDGEMDGLTCARQARERHPALRIIVISAHDDPEHIDAAFDAGAAAYIVKTAEAGDLATAVRQVFKHSIFLGRPRHGLSTEPPPPSNGSSAELTRREREILRLAADGHSNSQLARMLWVTEQTVKFHLSNIYRKIDVANRTEAGRWAQLNGILDEGSSASASVG